MRAAGMSMPEIAAIFNRPLGSIRAACLRYRPPPILTPWTMKDIARVAQWRKEGVSIAECAERLNRSVDAVRQVCHRHRIVTQINKPEVIREIIREGVKKGWGDRQIAWEAGTSEANVRATRQRMGLKGKRVFSNNRPRCWNCNVMCPLAYKVKNVGWYSAIVTYRGAPATEILCPDCAKAQGKTMSEQTTTDTTPTLMGYPIVITTDDVSKGEIVFSEPSCLPPQEEFDGTYPDTGEETEFGMPKKTANFTERRVAVEKDTKTKTIDGGGFVWERDGPEIPVIEGAGQKNPFAGIMTGHKNPGSLPPGSSPSPDHNDPES